METARVFKACKFRPCSTDDQAARLEQWFASVRWVCNAALEQRETDGRRKGTDRHGRPTIFKGCVKGTDDVIIQDSEIGWRMLPNDPDLAWLTGLPAQCREVALQDLDKAFDGFFKGRGGCSASRSRARNNSVRCQCWGGSDARAVFGKVGVRFSRIGRIRRNRHMKPSGRSGQASVTKEGNRRYVSLACDQRECEIAPDCESAIGVAWSVGAPITLSDGTCMELDPSLDVLEDKAKREQKKVSRSKRGSKRRRKRVARLAAIKRKHAARRKGCAHEITTRVVREPSGIAIEATSVRDPTASAKGTRARPDRLVEEKTDVNRRILDVAPCQTRQMLECKAARRGGTVIEVELQDIAMPCFAYGSVGDGHRKSRAKFVCRDCGYEETVDLNTARNILFRALPGRAMAPRRASRGSGSGSQCAQTAIASPPGPAVMHASEGRDRGGRNGKSVQHGEFP